MIIARVVGEVVSSQKESTLEGLKLLLVENTDPKGVGLGASIVCVDSVGAGIGELILYATGSSARQTEVTKDRPVDGVIMAIIDLIHLKGKNTFDKSTDLGE